jgi:integrating conjugative element protein (TIGR03746 family)
VDTQKAHISTLRLAMVILGVVVMALIIALQTAPKRITVHVPPDLRSGSTRLWWDIPPESVYAYGYYIFAQMNRWATDGEQDYKKNIHKLQNYLTPSCRATLERDFEKRNRAGELKNRVRGVSEMVGRGFSDDPNLRVKQLDLNTWQVTLDVTLDEYYGSEPVKRVLARYPIRIVRFDVNAEANPWGLAFDCYTSAPQRIEITDTSKGNERDE